MKNWEVRYKGKHYKIQNVIDSGLPAEHPKGGNYYQLDGLPHLAHASELSDLKPPEKVKDKKMNKADVLPGGKGDNEPDSKFSAKEIAMGIKTESEHTKNRKVAKEIAKDHLSEDSKYYAKLKASGLADELKDIKKSAVADDMVECKDCGKKMMSSSKSAIPMSAVLYNKKTKVPEKTFSTKHWLCPSCHEAQATAPKEEETKKAEAVLPNGMVERFAGKEQLKKDPKARWQEIKKALDNSSAFMNIQEELAPEKDDEKEEQGQDEASQEPEQGQSEQQAPEQDQSQDGMQDGMSGSVPDSQGQAKSDELSEDESQQMQGAMQGNASQDQGNDEQVDQQQDQQPEQDQSSIDAQEEQKLIEALRADGHSEPEIAFIVHGHHSPEMSELDATKAKVEQAHSDMDMEHTKRAADADHEHSQRMNDLEYQKSKAEMPDSQLEKDHRKRMLDLEYATEEKRKKEAELELEHKKRMLDLEYQQSQAELSKEDPKEDTARRQAQFELEMKRKEKELELQYKEKELKLKLKIQEESAKQKAELMARQAEEDAKTNAAVKKEQAKHKVAEAKKPPEKKEQPMRKSAFEEDLIKSESIKTWALGSDKSSFHHPYHGSVSVKKTPQGDFSLTHVHPMNGSTDHGTFKTPSEAGTAARYIMEEQHAKAPHLTFKAPSNE